MFAITIGFVFGCLQLAILYFLVNAMLKGKAADVFAFVMLKLVTWGGFAAIVMFFFRESIVLAGTGAAAVLVVGSFVGFWLRQRKQATDKEEKTVC